MASSSLPTTDFSQPCEGTQDIVGHLLGCHCTAHDPYGKLAEMRTTQLEEEEFARQQMQTGIKCMHSAGCVP